MAKMFFVNAKKKSAKKKFGEQIFNQRHKETFIHKTKNSKKEISLWRIFRLNFMTID